MAEYLYKVICDYYEQDKYPIETTNSEIYLVKAKDKESACELANAYFESENDTSEKYLYQLKVVAM